MPLIKAINTRYKGYLFRSRLEARWAVFLDHLGVEWGYEIEGYDLGYEGWYLPDFLVTSVNGSYGPYIEVKPGWESDDLALRKLSTLCEAQCKYGLLVCGDPIDVLTLKSMNYPIHKDGGWVGVHVGDFLDYLGTSMRPAMAAATAARQARFEHGATV